MFQNYFKTAIRSLMRNGLYSAINILGLAIGLACTMLIILYVRDEVSFDRFLSNSDHLYQIVSGTNDPHQPTEGKMGITGAIQGPHFMDRIPAIRSFVRVQHSYREIKTSKDVEAQGVVMVDSNFFSMFSFPFLRGNSRSCLLRPDAVVLTESMAKKQFGSTDVIGKAIEVKDNDRFSICTVTAVTYDCPQNSSIQFEMMLPFHESPGEIADAQGWFNFNLTTFVLLAPNADLKAVDAQMQKIYHTDAGAAVKAMEKQYHFTDYTVYSLAPFTQIHLDRNISQEGITNGSNPMYSYILSGIAAFILLIACINFVNLTVARSLKRAKEIGIRKVVGGSRRQLVWQFLGESMLLSLAAFLLAILLVRLALPVFNSMANKSLSLVYLLDAPLVLSFIGLYFLTSFLAGFYPALVLSGFDPVQTLYNRWIPGGRNYLQKGLVVVQFTLASFVIIATAVLFAQFRYLTTVKLGYDDTDLVRMYKQGLNVKEADLFRQQLMSDPDIIGVAPKDNGYSFYGGKINGDSGIGFVFATIDEAYLPLLKIPIIAGRNFSPDFPSDTATSVIVNEAFVKKAGWKQPIGETVFFQIDSSRRRVVGVVADYHIEPLNTAIKPQLFVKGQQRDGYGGALYVRIRPKSEATSMARIEKVFRSLFPLNPFSATFQNDDNRKNYEAEARWKQILFFSAVITVFISCCGLFGLAVLSAERRMKEIGVRKVLGASVASVVRILSRDFLWLVMLSLVLAIPCAWMAADRWLRGYPYRIRLNWELFSLPCILVVVIAVATVSSQAVKAAMANPAKSLRAE